MTETRTLSTLEVGQKDLMVMRSLLNLTGSRSGEVTWELIAAPGGDVTLVDVDSDAGLEQWKELQSADPRIVALTRKKDFPARFVLHKPVRSREFIQLLNEVAVAEASEEETVEPAQAVADAPGAWQGNWETMVVERPDQQYTLAEHLRRQSWRSPVVLTRPGWPLILIDPGSGAWFFDGSISELSPPMFAEVMPAAVAVPISSAQLVERCQGLKQRPLSELKWFAGLAQSRGQLHPDLAGNLEFMLTQVPSHASTNQAYQSLARILLRGPRSLDEVHAESEMAPETIVAFLNACYTSGYLLLNRSASAANF